LNHEQKREFDNFMAVGREFIVDHADFNDSLHAAAAQGLDLNPEATQEIVRMARPDLAYWLTKNPPVAHALMGMSGSLLRDKLQRLARDLDIKGTFARPAARPCEVDDYLEKRGAIKRRRR
jgi:hypothetical protein